MCICELTSPFCLWCVPLNKCLHDDDINCCISECYAGIDTQYYLWGVFRCVKTKETVIKEGMNIPLSVPSSEHPGDDYSNKDNSEVVDMEIDMVGGKNVGRVDEAVGKVKKEQCNNCDSFPGFTEKVENRLASAEPMGRPCTDVEGPPGFEEVLDLKVRGNPCKPTFRKENPCLNGEKATIKNEDTSTEKFPVGDMVSHSLQFQTGLWKQFKVLKINWFCPR